MKCFKSFTVVFFKLNLNVTTTYSSTSKKHIPLRLHHEDILDFVNQSIWLCLVLLIFEQPFTGSHCVGHKHDNVITGIYVPLTVTVLLNFNQASVYRKWFNCCFLTNMTMWLQEVVLFPSSELPVCQVPASRVDERVEGVCFPEGSATPGLLQHQKGGWFSWLGF